MHRKHGIRHSTNSKFASARALFENISKSTTLYSACENGDLGLVRKYVEDFGANVNAEGCLAVSLQKGHNKISIYLMENGSKIVNDMELDFLYNFCKKGLINVTKVGDNLIDIVCKSIQRGDKDMCQKLIKSFLDRDGDINLKNIHNKTVLTVAAENEQFHVLRFLLSQGSTWDDINGTAGEHGLSPLYYLCKSGDIDLVRKCIKEYHADVQSKGCLTVCLKNKHHQISNFILEHGAKIENDKDLSILYKFCKEGFIDLYKVNNNFADILCYASKLGDLKMCQKLIKSVPGGDINMNNIINQNPETA